MSSNDERSSIGDSTTSRTDIFEVDDCETIEVVGTKEGPKVEGVDSKSSHLSQPLADAR